MIVLGDISGIQQYLFDVAEAGGGQARRLRARSFMIQLIAETAALRVLLNLEWPRTPAHFILSAAGKFVLAGPRASDTEESLQEATSQITDWLLRETRGELRFVMGWSTSDSSQVGEYRQAQQRLQYAKGRPWASGETWDVNRLILAPLDTPCAICGRASAEVEETDPDTRLPRPVCRWCAQDLKLGQRLPRGRWLTVLDGGNGDFELFGLMIAISDRQQINIEPNTIAVANLTDPESRPSWCPEERFLRRRLMTHIPLTEGKPTWFVEIAKRSMGDHLLAVLKADADSLGQAIGTILEGNANLDPLTRFSNELDAFFTMRLKQEIESEPRWTWIYTIFAGGDDLIMVGPWDTMIAFAGRLAELFRLEFGGRSLTISAGVALFKPKRPIKAAVAEADRLLEQAKTNPTDNPKDQLACLGQVWKWKDHQTIGVAAGTLVDWVEGGQMERGWLHTLLGLVEVRHPSLAGKGEPGSRPDYLATARLAHHVSRNYRRNTEARRWAEQIVERFDDPTHIEVRYLPAVLRYALTATRTPSVEE